MRERWCSSGSDQVAARATACCDALNFFTGQTTARTWIAAHPGILGRVVGQAQAADIAARTFGPLLNR